MKSFSFAVFAPILSCAILILFILAAILLMRQRRRSKPHKHEEYFKPFHLLLAGFFVAAAVMFFPVYYFDYFSAAAPFSRAVKSVLLSVHNTLRLFVLDGEFDVMRDHLLTLDAPAALLECYGIYAALVYVLAPVFSAGVVLSFCRGASALVRYKFRLPADIYLLSDLNECSAALATDILSNTKKNKNQAKKKDEEEKETEKFKRRRRVVVFANVTEEEDEQENELLTKVKRLGAICLRKDVADIGLKPRWKGVFRKIYLIGMDEDENMRRALTMINICREKCNDPKTEIYVFASSSESEVLLNTVDSGKIKIRRQDESRNLMLKTMLQGHIFGGGEHSVVLEEGDMKVVRVAIVGFGLYGMELMKALCWCGQLPGYRVEIHVFDQDPNSKERVKSAAPELIKYNRVRRKGQPYYKITFHNNIDVKSYRFLEEISTMEPVTSVFVTLGDDELNIDIALKLRMQLGRDVMKRKSGAVPPIYAVVYSEAKTRAAAEAGQGGLKDTEGNGYGIEFIGGIESCYSLDSLELSVVEQLGHQLHSDWSEKRTQNDSKEAKAKEEQKERYDRFEYNRRSTIARAIYELIRSELKIPEQVDRDTLARYEHNRWMVYMRAEGYIYMPDPDAKKEGRTPKKNEINKTHPMLKPYQNLSKEVREMDMPLETKQDGQTPEAQ